MLKQSSPTSNPFRRKKAERNCCHRLRSSRTGRKKSMVHTTVDSTLCQTNWTHESFSRTESGNRTRACLKTPEGRIIGSKLELGLIGDAKETLSELLPLLKHKKNDKHLKACLEK